MLLESKSSLLIWQDWSKWDSTGGGWWNGSIQDMGKKLGLLASLYWWLWALIISAKNILRTSLLIVWILTCTEICGLKMLCIVWANQLRLPLGQRTCLSLMN